MTLSKIVAIGGNQPTRDTDVLETLQLAVAEIKNLPGRVEKISSYYQTPAYPVGAGPDFVNAALIVDSPLSSHKFLNELHKIEVSLGRVRRDRWGARVVDLDLIADGGQVLPDIDTWRRWHDLAPDRQQVETPDQLILPHPRMQNRSFVLVPLVEICPEWVHPVLGRTIAEMHADLTEEDRNSVVKLGDRACQ
ncbi:MAG: 2-amino-4-hydroxy-6-hydroxymethyldihydropteridine diphosphokinase [Pseudomonadota bacterium]|jgi:2-amino-4-hydroxy-6-hydroxymethyldihydropteridine diphosphokinase|uniref:2-amino-4-hydroxy-6-hydroxymethyldihydropteridine pyrophosphokinase n=1 Tax=Pseudooceanicola nitratireducens TaxID=517719 RepID=A0A1I1HRW0_9RHOB|nr:2-amino-4-hydroxy-6-hydroxymethyldihydropteridine diphosphokinase [Pseudooceanicola nitratireducens]MEC7298434.1 2-amino-4-hydroxy-6-hydroxymethyldihydropteridine diphosphokinase [Pseudomonadota bacterium]MBY6157592.1 2-amino-4-hydroxy-6-hydroxymethyldihydropteridine diphosphokinase [Pseudooceanicola nitratireducens]MEC7794083.1 2-amino-4-hydroxy-6-hydroxymethyldihydropteridine diphosphokinase [Pseudomonadota bacterium]MEC8667075.1 2-amino-4-hydroxy-6-hydroxymethyldihydropteridine diphosphok